MTHAIRFHKTGGPEVLVWEEVAVGKPGPGEARIRHTAVGLNFIDIYNRSGLYPVAVAERARRRGGRRGRGGRLRRHRPEAGRSRRLWQCADRRLCRSAADPGRSPAQAARRHRRQDRGGHDAEGPDRAIPDPADLSRSRPATPSCCTPRPAASASSSASGRSISAPPSSAPSAATKRRSSPKPMAAPTRSSTRARTSSNASRDHRRQKVPVVYDFVGKDTFLKSLDCLAPLRRRRAVRAILRRRRTAQSRPAGGEGIAVTSPARRSTPTPPSATTSSPWRTNCSMS